MVGLSFFCLGKNVDNDILHSDRLFKIYSHILTAFSSPKILSVPHFIGTFENVFAALFCYCRMLEFLSLCVLFDLLRAFIDNVCRLLSNHPGVEFRDLTMRLYTI